MTECQRKQQMRKLRSYEQQALEAQKLLEQQKKRVQFFQGLITQLRLALKEESDK